MSSLLYGVPVSTAEAQAAAAAAAASETDAETAAAAAQAAETNITGREQADPMEITSEYSPDPARFVVAKGPAGPFGWGGPEGQNVPGNDLDAIGQNGSFRTVLATAANHPPDGGGGGGNTVLHMQHSDNNAVQLYTAIKGSGRIWQRVKDAGTWSKWKPLGGLTFDDAEAVVADTSLTYTYVDQGAVISTLKDQYVYEVAASDATDQHITTAGGLKLYVIPQGGVYDIEAWGTPSAARFNAACAVICDQVTAAQPAGDFMPKFTLRFSSTLAADTKLKCHQTDFSRAVGLNVDFRTARFVAQSGGDLVSTEPLLSIKARGAEIRVGFVDCNRICCGARLLDCQGSELWLTAAVRWPTSTGDNGYGWRVDGITTRIHIRRGWGIQWDTTDAEYSSEANFTGHVFWLDGIDFSVQSIGGGWAGNFVKFGSACSLVHCTDIHPYNGNTSFVRVDPSMIQNYAAGQVFIHDSYLDNGLIHDYAGTLRLDNCNMLELGANVTLSDPEMRVYCNAANDGTYPASVASANCMGLSVGYFSDPTDTYHWLGDTAAIESSYDEQNLLSNRVKVRQRDVNVFQRGDGVATVQNFRMGGAFAEEYHSADGGTVHSLSVIYDPINGTIRFPGLPTSSAGLPAGSLWNSAGTLKIA